MQPCSGRPRQLGCTRSHAKAPGAAAPPSDAIKAPGLVHQASLMQNAGRLQAGQQGSQAVQAVPAATAVVAAAPASSRPALNSTAVRLSYNPLPSLAGLPAVMASILDDPVSASWLQALPGTLLRKPHAVFYLTASAGCFSLQLLIFRCIIAFHQYLWPCPILRQPVQAELQWLDLSHCKLLHIDSVLTSFPKVNLDLCVHCLLTAVVLATIRFPSVAASDHISARQYHQASP